MTEHMNEEMLNAMASVQEVKVGDLVQGEVLTIDDNKQAIVGIIGAGVEGVIPLKELSTITVQNVTDVVNIGDIIDVVVISEIGKSFGKLFSNGITLVWFISMFSSSSLTAGFISVL